MNTSTGAEATARISSAARAARPASRPVMATRAPRAASPSAVALPIPPVPPVIRTVFPAIDCIRVSLSVLVRRTTLPSADLDGIV